jgi:hypothetical protein
LEFFGDGLPEKKLQLVGMSILLILLSPESGYYSLFLQGVIRKDLKEVHMSYLHRDKKAMYTKEEYRRHENTLD